MLDFCDYFDKTIFRSEFLLEWHDIIEKVLKLIFGGIDDWSEINRRHERRLLSWMINFDWERRRLIAFLTKFVIIIIILRLNQNKSNTKNRKKVNKKIPSSLIYKLFSKSFLLFAKEMKVERGVNWMNIIINIVLLNLFNWFFFF